MLAGLFGCFVVGHPAMGQEVPSRGDRPDMPPQPHPWIADAPPGFARAIDLGQVRISTDTEQLELAKKQALTRFRIQSRYRSRYTVQKSDRDPKDSSQLRTKVQARIWLERLDLEHEIVFREDFRPEDPWSHPLVQHEFDHVAISTDPRWVRLAKKTLSEPIREWLSWPSGTQLEEETVNRRIQETMRARIEELERIVQCNYDRLDRDSADGRTKLANRPQFFLELYSKDWLSQCRFEYLDLVREATQESSEQGVQEHYMFLAPP